MSTQEIYAGVLTSKRHSPRTWRRKLKEWHMEKNITLGEKLSLLQIHEERKRSGKDTVWIFCGKELPSEKLMKIQRSLGSVLECLQEGVSKETQGYNCPLPPSPISCILSPESFPQQPEILRDTRQSYLRTTLPLSELDELGTGGATPWDNGTQQDGGVCSADTALPAKPSAALVSTILPEERSTSRPKIKIPKRQSETCHVVEAATKVSRNLMNHYRKGYADCTRSSRIHRDCSLGHPGQPKKVG